MITSTLNERWNELSNQLLAELYEHKFRSVVHKLRTYRDLGEANQIATDTFESIYKLCQEGKQFPSLEDATRYWFKIAIREARKAPDQHVESLNSEQHSHYISQDDIDFANTEEYRTIRKELLRILREIDPKYGDVLRHRFYDKMRHKEIASLMRIKEETVRKRLQRGLAMLRVKLKEEPDKWLLMEEVFRYMLIVLITLSQEQKNNHSKPVTSMPVFPFISIETISRENEHGKQA